MVDHARSSITMSQELSELLNHPAFRYGIHSCQDQIKESARDLASRFFSLRSKLMTSDSNLHVRSRSIGEGLCLLHSLSSPYRLHSKDKAILQFLTMQMMDYVPPQLEVIPAPFRLNEISHSSLTLLINSLEFEEETILQYARGGPMTANIKESVRLSLVRANLLGSLYLQEISDWLQAGTLSQGRKILVQCWALFFLLVFVWGRRFSVLKN